MTLLEPHAQGAKAKVPDSDILEAYHSEINYREAARKIGLSEAVFGRRAKQLGLAPSRKKRPRNEIKRFTDEELAGAWAKAKSVSDAAKALGIGNSELTFQARRLGLPSKTTPGAPGEKVPDSEIIAAHYSEINHTAAAKKVGLSQRQFSKRAKRLGLDASWKKVGRFSDDDIRAAWASAETPSAAAKTLGITAGGMAYHKKRLALIPKPRLISKPRPRETRVSKSRVSDTQIRAAHDRARNHHVAAKMVGLSDATFSIRAKRLGLVSPWERPRKWTSEEIRTEWNKWETAADVARALGLTNGGIRYHARILHLPRKSVRPNDGAKMQQLLPHDLKRRLTVHSLGRRITATSAAAALGDVSLSGYLNWMRSYDLANKHKNGQKQKLGSDKRLRELEIARQALRDAHAESPSGTRLTSKYYNSRPRDKNRT